MGSAPGTSVNLVAPATDPAGYTFSQWTVNGATQPAGQKSITFAMGGDMTAVAEYTLNGYALTVQSTPPSGLSIASSTSDGGITNYTKTAGAYGASVNLQAPATDPSGYTFSQWTLNGAAQSGGQKSITFTMDAAVTAVAHYTANVGYTLSVQSTPPTGAYITSSTSDGGITNYTLPGVAYGMSANLQAAATDPAGYTFSQWTLNGAAQADGQKSITFTMDGAVTAVAHYTANTSYALTVGATPPVKQIIRLQHRARRHDELHEERSGVRRQREPAGAGGGSEGVYLLAMDGERRGAACRAEVRHVPDGCGRDRHSEV